MSTRSRHPVSILSLALLVIVAACGPTPRSAGPASPYGSTAEPSAAAADTQTDTAWGRIWDGVPVGFPIFPGSKIAGETSPEPVSARYSVATGDTAVIATWMQTALENAGLRTEALSGPLEDGSFVLESVGEVDCRVQVIVAPMGGLTFVTVRYGAACPAG